LDRNVRYFGPPESMVYNGDRPVVTRILDVLDEMQFNVSNAK
jgi:hypothetical protein